jgi:hypothetical protein
MTEDQFAQNLANRLAQLLAPPHKVECKRSLLYDLSIDELGKINLGVDPDTGQPIKGKGKGFEQDILIFEEVSGRDTSIIPRIIAEVKLDKVTTHDVIVYSEKADRIRRVYPYVRYGFVLGGMKNIPGRVLRLGQSFDFIAAIPSELDDLSFNIFWKVIDLELKTSKALTGILFGTQKTILVHKHVVIRNLNSSD